MESYLAHLISFSSTVLVFICFLIPLIFFHELGHFLFAKYFGVRVEDFSIGFGPKILKYKKGDTTYSLSLIPLGGYVKMFGDNILEKEEVPHHERVCAFTHKTKWQRFWIVFGGPLANFILAFVLFGLISVSGETVPEPRMGVIFSNTDLYERGLRTGDKLEKVNGRSILSIFDFATLDEDHVLTLSVLRGGEAVEIKMNMSKDEVFKKMSVLPPALRAPLVADRNQQIWGVTLNSQKVDEDVPLVDMAKNHRGEVYLIKVKNFTTERREFDYSSIQTIVVESGVDEFIASLVAQNFWPVDLMIKQISDNSAAQAAGIEAQDIIVGLNGKTIFHFQQLINHVSQMKNSESVQLQIYRGGESLLFDIVPRREEVNGKMTNMIGVYTSMVFSRPRMVQTPSRGPFYSTKKALLQTWETTVVTVGGFKKLILGAVPLKSVGGPIAIAKVAADSFAISLSHFIKIMAIISVNLAVINLFPIPVLDGGHILFLMIEAITRRPISPRIVEVSLKFGVSVLFLLIFMAIYNDILRVLN